MEQLKKPEVPRRDRISTAGIVGALMGVLLLVLVRDLPEESAAFPRLVGILMLGLGVLEAGRAALLGPNAAERDERAGDNNPKPVKAVLVFLVATTVYVFLMPVIGFYAITLVYTLFTMPLMGIRKLKVLVPVPVLTVAVLYFVFTVQLRVPLPQGLLI